MRRGARKGTFPSERPDRASIEQIRTHLAEVAKVFASGDFAMPERIHGRVLPGVPELIAHKDDVAYRYSATERGAQVFIATTQKEALAAVHAFLRAQIEDHRTEDPVSRP